MFEALTNRLSSVFDGLTGRGALTEADVDAALREVRLALIEADVSLPVIKDFLVKVRERAIGADVLRSVTPGQQIVKIVHDILVDTLGEEAQGLSLEVVPPAVIMMIGLQGSGKTTSTAKIALRLTNRDKKKVLMASLDTRRPAAQEQLKVLGEQTGVATLPIIAGQSPADIARRALQAAKLSGYDVLMLDTAGRLHIDEALMAEIAQIRDLSQPAETLLVADSLSGQDAINVARTFKERIGISGIVLTRIDGDGRGGAALSMRAITGAPIKLLGTGEKIDALEDFHPRRIAGRILGQGDVVSLVEKAAETVDAEKAEAMARKMQKGQFDLDDLAEQLRQMRRMGGMQGILGMLPGVAKAKDQLAAAGMDDSMLKRQEAIILSMTKEERAKPDVLNGSRRKRIAKGSGVDVSEVNKLMKMHRQMADVMKKMGKGKGLMSALFGGRAPQMPPGGGLPGLGGGGMGSAGLQLPPGMKLPPGFGGKR
ncbi:MAG: signal recognition particle protein [Alphaproteobacteria bacterium]|nr:signal recognition particle protein [Alphaproteobacteria bacterium]